MSYRLWSKAAFDRGVEFIALNDAPGDADALDLETVKNYISTITLSAAFEVDPILVARAVLKVRRPFLKEYEAFTEKEAKRRK